MAIWQFDFAAIDKNKIISDNDICFWDKEPADNVYNISFLEKRRSWSKDIIQYGNLDGTCIELLLSNNRIEEIHIRLDIKCLDYKTIECLIDYLNRISARIYYEEKIYDVSKKELMNLIKNSDAYRFCNNPELFISNI